MVVELDANYRRFLVDELDLSDDQAVSAVEALEQFRPEWLS